MKCPTCGRQMRPLFIGEYCPSDCDKKAKPIVDDFWDEEPTPTMQADACPTCGSIDTDPFVVQGYHFVAHCNKCGAVW